MYIKTTVKYHLTPVRMTVIKKIRDNKCWRWCGKKETLVHCCWEWKLVKPLWKTVEVPQQLKRQLPYDPAIQFLRIYPKGIKTGYKKSGYWKDTCIPMSIAALSTMAKIYLSMDEWI